MINADRIINDLIYGYVGRIQNQLAISLGRKQRIRVN